MKDLANNIKRVQTLDPIVLTADQLFTGVDRQGFESVVLAALLGLSGDTLSGSVYADLILEHSDDDSTYTAVTSANHVTGGTVDSSGIFATINAPAEDETQYSIGYTGGKRYCRINYDITGTHTNGMPVAGLAILGDPTYTAVV